MLITIEEYAKNKGISRQAVYAAIQRGSLEAVKKCSGKTNYLIDGDAKLKSRNLNPFTDRYNKISDHPLYTVLSGMKERCYNSNADYFKNYGGRGISICDEWRNDPIAFIQWGEKHGYQKGLQIDRIDNDGNYEPSNCRFVSPKDNCNNKRNNIPLELRNAYKEARQAKKERIKQRKKTIENKPYEEYQQRIIANREGFHNNIYHFHKYVRAIKNCDFDLLEKGVFDDMINDYMLLEYSKHYNQDFLAE